MADRQSRRSRDCHATGATTVAQKVNAVSYALELDQLHHQLTAAAAIALSRTSLSTRHKLPDIIRAGTGLHKIRRFEVYLGGGVILYWGHGGLGAHIRHPRGHTGTGEFPACRSPRLRPWVRQRVRLLERNLATKADIEMLRLETKANIDTLRQETEKLIALGKNDIIKWVVGANLGIAAMIVAAFKLL